MSAPITQAHYDLRRQVLFSAPDDGAQLIADSEAGACEPFRETVRHLEANELVLAAELDEVRAACIAERDQLRAERGELEVERLTAACDKFSNAEIAQGDWKARADRAEAELAAERERRDDLVADINDACITLASAKDDCDDYALLNTGFKITAVRDVLIQYIPRPAMKEGAK